MTEPATRRAARLDKLSGGARRRGGHPATWRASRLAKLLTALLLPVLAAAACAGSDTEDAGEDASPVADAALASEATTTTAAPAADAETNPTTAAATSADVAETEPAAASATAGGAERIVSLSPTGTEMLFAIGAGDRVVAVDRFSYFPEEAPVTEIDGWSPNIEAIASYEPDLVVLQTNGDVIAALEALGIAVFAHDAPVTFEEVYTQIERLGAVTGQEAGAARMIESMRSRIAELIDAAPDSSGLTYYHELDDTLYSVTGSTFIGRVYGLFGLVNIADPADADGSAWGYPQLSDEYIVDADPDVIFLADTLCCGQSAETVSERPGWDQLTAVQAGRVVELNDDIASRWGPRLVDFIAAISEVVASAGAAA